MFRVSKLFFHQKHIRTNKQLSLRSGNPVLSKSTFTTTTNITDTMTIEGMVNKTVIGFFLLVRTGYFKFEVINSILLIGGAIGGLIVALITIFKKHWTTVTVPILDNFGA